MFELKRMGVKTVINLRGSDDHSKKEKAWAEAAGLRFINVPESNWFRPDQKNIDAIIKQIDVPENQPVFIHCKRGSDRTGTVVAVYRITHNGWTGKQANDEAKKFGFGFWQVWMKDYINDYYRDYVKSHR
jgi:tyrosine-protein phosphatase SIW14